MTEPKTYKIEIGFQEKILLNSFARAAHHVRDQTENVIEQAAQIRKELESGQSLRRGFGNNSLSEAVVKYNTLEDLVGIALEGNGKSAEEVNVLMSLARTKKLDSSNGVYYFLEGVVTVTI